MNVTQAINLLLTMIEGANRLREAIQKARDEGRDTLTKEEVDVFAEEAETANQRLKEQIDALK